MSLDSLMARTCPYIITVTVIFKMLNTTDGRASALQAKSFFQSVMVVSSTPLLTPERICHDGWIGQDSYSRILNVTED